MSAEGAYAARHRQAPAAMRWSHAARFRFARRLLEPLAGARLLDYGCGDGTFLASVRDLFPEAVGAEIDAALAADDQQRLGDGGVRFVHAPALASEPEGAFGAIACMEVLEHCTDPVVDSILAELRRLLAPDGRLVVSVPVETGAALLAKQASRALAAFRRVEGYVDRERYRPAEFVRMLLAGPATGIPRPIYESRFPDGTPNRYHGHKGFNWMALRDRIGREFRVEAARFSPLPGLPGGFNSQAWFVCRR